MLRSTHFTSGHQSVTTNTRLLINPSRLFFRTRRYQIYIAGATVRSSHCTPRDSRDLGMTSPETTCWSFPIYVDLKRHSLGPQFYLPYQHSLFYLPYSLLPIKLSQLNLLTSLYENPSHSKPSQNPQTPNVCPLSLPWRHKELSLRSTFLYSRLYVSSLVTSYSFTIYV